MRTFFKERALDAKQIINLFLPDWNRGAWVDKQLIRRCSSRTRSISLLVEHFECKNLCKFGNDSAHNFHIRIVVVVQLFKKFYVHEIV